MAVSAELGRSGWKGQAQTARRRIDLSAISGIYYRRPTAFSFHDAMSEEERRWANVQARLGFGGLLASLRPWIETETGMPIAAALADALEGRTER